MGLKGNITAIIELGERAYPHLYDVYITFPSILKTATDTENPSLNKPAIAETVQYDGQDSFSFFYSEALMGHYLEKADRVKGMTITFRETSEFTYFRKFKEWKEKMYDSEANVFLPGDPRGEIIVRSQIASSSEKYIEFKHTGCIVKSVQLPQFSYSSTDPLTTVVSFTLENFTVSSPVTPTPVVVPNPVTPTTIQQAGTP